MKSNSWLNDFAPPAADRRKDSPLNKGGLRGILLLALAAAVFLALLILLDAPVPAKDLGPMSTIKCDVCGLDLVVYDNQVPETWAVFSVCTPDTWGNDCTDYFHVCPADRVKPAVHAQIVAMILEPK